MFWIFTHGNEYICNRKKQFLFPSMTPQRMNYSTATPQAYQAPQSGKTGLPSITGFGCELLRRSEGRKRVRSLKLQLFCTLVGLPSAVMSVLGDLLSPTEACLLLMLWPLGLAMRTRSLKLSFWLWRTEPWLSHLKTSFRSTWANDRMEL